MKLSQASALRSESGSESDMLETNLTKGSHQRLIIQRFEHKKRLMLMLMLKSMLMSMLMFRLMI